MARRYEKNAAQVKRLLDRFASISGDGVFGIAIVVARDDQDNNSRVRIYPLIDQNLTFKEVESEKIQWFPYAETVAPARGENHGYYYIPEFGDFVLYTKLGGLYFIIGSINYPHFGEAGLQKSNMLIPCEAQHTQKNGLEYCDSHYPDLKSKQVHGPYLTSDGYHPASFLQRWRRFDFLIYDVTKIGDEAHSSAKLMELRSSENQMLQLVDVGNFNTKPGKAGKLNKGYSPTRQTDYRDLWESLNVNKEFWVKRTDIPPLPHESKYVKLATDTTPGGDSDWGDVGADLHAKIRSEFRNDERLIEGSIETAKTYCPVWQTVLTAKGEERYFQDKIGAPVPYGTGGIMFKIKKWIEDVGSPYDPEDHHFNVGHYLTLSNTIFRRRAMLSTKKGHQLTMSDIDLDEKIILNSYRGKYLYMEDGMPWLYNVMWLASEKHHIVFCDHQLSPYLIDSNGAERHRLLDPNQRDLSSYLLIQTEKYQKIWLTDSPESQRIHIHTISGHEMLFLDHDSKILKISPPKNKGKIQITTNDKKMQIVMDVLHGDITIMNHNLGGDSSGGRANTGDISLYAAHDILLHADNKIEMRANKGYDIQSSDGPYSVVACSIGTSSVCGAPSKKEPVRPTVLTDIETTEGLLINKYDPS